MLNAFLFYYINLFKRCMHTFLKAQSLSGLSPAVSEIMQLFFEQQEVLLRRKLIKYD